MLQLVSSIPLIVAYVHCAVYVASVRVVLFYNAVYCCAYVVVYLLRVTCVNGDANCYVSILHILCIACVLHFVLRYVRCCLCIASIAQKLPIASII